MKKIIIVLFSLLFLVSCQKTGGGNLEDIKKRGYITVAMEGTWQPWTYHNEENELVGYDVEVGKLIADYLGVDVQYVEGEWDGLLEGVKAGRYDMLVNGCGVTEERERSYDFSIPYAYDIIAVITSGDNKDINSMEDLNGKNTANTITSTYAKVAEKYGAKVTPVDDLNKTFLLLDRGDIDATLNALVTYNDYMKANPNSNFKVACLYDESQPIAIAMKKGSSELKELVDKSIAEASENGKLSELSNKYFEIDISKIN